MLTQQFASDMCVHSVCSQDMKQFPVAINAFMLGQMRPLFHVYRKYASTTMFVTLQLGKMKGNM